MIPHIARCFSVNAFGGRRHHGWTSAASDHVLLFFLLTSLPLGFFPLTYFSVDISSFLFKFSFSWVFSCFLTFFKVFLSFLHFAWKFLTFFNSSYILFHLSTTSHYNVSAFQVMAVIVKPWFRIRVWSAGPANFLILLIQDFFCEIFMCNSTE